MKTNYWMIFGVLIAASAVAQNSTNTLPPIPAPITAASPEPAAPAQPAAAPTAEPVKTAPAKHKKPAPKHAALKEPTVALVPGPAEVAIDNLNVRGQVGLKGETIEKLKKGEPVTVLAQITLDKHEVGEPAQWAKITLPSSTHVWVFSKFIDATSKTVTSKKLNLRAGPGENFSVLGVVQQGDVVKEITTKGGWIEIEPPANAYAFVAAMYLKQESSGNMAANVPPSSETAPMPTPTPTSVPEPAPIMTEPAPSPVAAASGAPAGPRIVSHEGVVGHVGSVIAPTAYELYDPATREEINYLYSTSTNLDISRYNNMRIIVTGEEGVSQRWTNTPVLTIHSIVVLDTNAVPKVYLPTPRQRH